MMDILILVPDKNTPSCRFRVLQYLDPLEEFGIALEVVELSRQKKERRKMLESAGRFDAVILHRKLLNRFDYARLRHAARRLIYDFDDAVMFRDSNAPRLESGMRRRKFQRQVTGADLVITGNSYLARWASAYNRKVTVIPSVVDLAPFPGEPVPGSGKTIGWMGTGSNFVYLSMVRPALELLIRDHPEVTFRVVSDETPDLPGLPVVSKRWSRAEEVSDLTGFEIGIMPLLSDPWTKGKCALKILQYGAAFLPVVCSPVGANLEVVEEGVNGYFAGSPAEWKERLEELLGSPEKREEMGRAARKIVEERYSLTVMAPRLARVLKEAIE